jgi:hypothetical protein
MVIEKVTQDDLTLPKAAEMRRIYMSFKAFVGCNQVIDF